ncbi:MAG: hypothetical protein ACRD09_11695 [Vicinamibacterales bacterium]
MSGTPAAVDDHTDLSLLFHQLNNQLGIILANAELLEAKAADETSRRRGAQLVASTLDALATVKDIRQLLKGQ